MELPIAATQDMKQPSKRHGLIAASPESVDGAHGEVFVLVGSMGVGFLNWNDF